MLLGVLAFVALPRFVNLRSDATIASMQAIKASLESGVKLVNAKAIVKNQTSGVQDVSLNYTGIIRLNSGYPIANWETSLV